ncbi:hypothetical protein V8E54_004761 [Elaphomyces granulatus]
MQRQRPQDSQPTYTILAKESSVQNGGASSEKHKFGKLQMTFSVILYFMPTPYAGFQRKWAMAPWGGVTLSYLLATRFPGKVIPDCVRAIFNSETGELKGVVYHPRGERSGFVAARVNPGWYDIRMGIYIEIPEDYLASALVIDHYLSSDPVQKCFSDGQSRFSSLHTDLDVLRGFLSRPDVVVQLRDGIVSASDACHQVKANSRLFIVDIGDSSHSSHSQLNWIMVATRLLQNIIMQDLKAMYLDDDIHSRGCAAE